MPRIKKILIANRGEIALRVIRAARELGIGTVSVHSTADEGSLHVKFADESVCIGPPAASKSYLHIPAILSAAEITGADAVHPGYGFLAENAEFAQICERANLTFIGPHSKQMRRLGDKIAARTLMAAHGLPILPGTGILRSEQEAQCAVAEIGLPIILKASAGGGGRGMKIVFERSRLGEKLKLARAEAEASFGNGSVFLERYLEAPRHIEVQVIGDGKNLIALGERECSIQRRHQKLVEEAPAPALLPVERAQLLERVTQAVRAIGYRSVGTLEFLFQRSTAGEAQFYFMEMNPRIQVEHTVTEMVSGVDLVREQIRIAMDEPLRESWLQAHRETSGHSIEVRINAEDPVSFLPSAGRITALHLPGGLGVRVDTHIYQGYVVPPHYDALLAKLIVYAEDRPSAISRLRRALHECVIEGIRTNLDVYRRLVEHEDFLQARLDTHFIERFLPAQNAASSKSHEPISPSTKLV